MTRLKDLLTATAVRAAHCTGHPTKLFDGGGLFLLVNQSGTLWHLKYRRTSYPGSEGAHLLGRITAVRYPGAHESHLRRRNQGQLRCNRM